MEGERSKGLREITQLQQRGWDDGVTGYRQMPAHALLGLSVYNPIAMVAVKLKIWGQGICMVEDTMSH